MSDIKSNWVEFDSGRKCPECGKPIMRRRLTNAGFVTGFESDMMCSCEVKRREVERTANINKGTRLIRDDMLMSSGLLKRWQSRTFDNFICQKGQEEAYAAAQDFANQFYSSGNGSTGLMLCGATGSGKTHLAAAITHFIIDTRSIGDNTAERAGSNGYYHEHYSPVKFTTTVDLLSRIKAAYSDGEGGSAQSIVSEYQRAALMILDDFGAEKPTEWVTERFFEIIDYRYGEELPMIITTNAIPDEIKNRLGARIYDRIREMCRLITITTHTQRATAK